VETEGRGQEAEKNKEAKKRRRRPKPKKPNELINSLKRKKRNEKKKKKKAVKKEVKKQRKKAEAERKRSKKKVERARELAKKKKKKENKITAEKKKSPKSGRLKSSSVRKCSFAVRRKISIIVLYPFLSPPSIAIMGKLLYLGCRVFLNLYSLLARLPVRFLAYLAAVVITSLWTSMCCCPTALRRFPLRPL
jgi:hypothetical protein